MLLAENQEYHVHHGDCIEHMATMPAASVDMSVWSPPFPAVYAYTNAEADIGNSEDLRAEAKIHLSFFYRQFARILKPGRVVVVHVQQIVRMKRQYREGGVIDFRGMNIRLGERAGLTFEYDWAVRKNPQALKNGSKVLTPSRWVEIQELAIGDEVIGSDGAPTVVKGVYHHGHRQMYRVGFSDGSSVECDGRHLWQVETVNGPSKTMTTDDIRHLGTHSLAGEARFRIPIMSAPARLSSGCERPIDPYTLGVILGDGAITSRGSAFLTCEHEIVAMATVPEGHSWRRIKGSDKGGGTVATYATNGAGWGNNLLLQGLRSLRLFGLRAWEKHVPESYLFAPAWHRLEMLRGLMDTDGTIKTRSGIVAKFCTTSKQLAADVAFLAQSLGGVARTDTEENSRYVYKGEERFGRMKYLVSLRMPDGCNPFKLPRKADRWRPTKKSVCRWITSITPTTVEACTCIEVAAADHLYVTEHCIVTHNSQAIRTKSRELQFSGLESDRARSRGAMPDYLLKFRAKGDNAAPVDSDDQVSRNEWIKWAECCWSDIRETNTLNVAEGRAESDTKHICPLQLDVIDRLVRLYSNPGEIVFSPFAGIGSELYQALLLGRRAYGCELKAEYHAAALKNCERAISRRAEGQRSLFDAVAEIG